MCVWGGNGQASIDNTGRTVRLLGHGLLHRHALLLADRVDVGRDVPDDGCVRGKGCVW